MNNNRVMILDATLLTPILESNLNNLLFSIKNDFNIKHPISFKAENMLRKTILTNAICKLISETNDQPVDTLLPEYNIMDDIDVSKLGSYYNNIYNSMYSLYNQMFRFSGNVMINVDCMLSGNNLIVTIYTKGLE